jgi:hypothetical protein
MLAVHSLAEYYVEPGVTTYYGTGWRHFGWGVATTTPAAIERVDDWAVFEGEHRLDVPTYLETIGDSNGKIDLQRRITSNRSAGTALEVIGAAGVVAALAGVIGVESATTIDQQVAWSDVSLGGLGAAIGGFVIGSFPANRAHRLESRPATTLDRHQVEDDVQDYNARLADKLGLSPDEALRLEQGPPRRGPPESPPAP